MGFGCHPSGGPLGLLDIGDGPRVRDKLLVKETRRGDVDRVAELIHAGPT